MRRLEVANLFNQYTGIGSCKAFVAETNVSGATFVTRLTWNCLDPLVTTRCCRVSLNLRQQENANKRPKFIILPKDNATGFVRELADPHFLSASVQWRSTHVALLWSGSVALDLSNASFTPGISDAFFSVYAIKSPRSMRSFGQARHSVTIRKAILPTWPSSSETFKAQRKLPLYRKTELLVQTVDSN